MRGYSEHGAVANNRTTDFFMGSKMQKKKKK
jgi:hypothetical protein